MWPGNISAVEPGSKVIHHLYGDYRYAVVDHCTRTQIVLHGGRRFSRKTGVEIGFSSMSQSLIYNLTPEHEAEMKEIKQSQDLIAARNLTRTAINNLGVTRMNWEQLCTLTEALDKIAPLDEKLVVLLKEHQRREEHGRTQ